MVSGVEEWGMGGGLVGQTLDLWNYLSPHRQCQNSVELYDNCDLTGVSSFFSESETAPGGADHLQTKKTLFAANKVIMRNGFQSRSPEQEWMGSFYLGLR